MVGCVAQWNVPRGWELGDCKGVFLLGERENFWGLLIVTSEVDTASSGDGVGGCQEDGPDREIQRQDKMIEETCKNYFELPQMLNRMTSEEEESVSGKVTFRDEGSPFKKIDDLFVQKPLVGDWGFLVSRHFHNS